MEYIPLSQNIYLSLGEIQYDDIEYISNMLKEMEDMLIHSKRKMRGKERKCYIILYNKHTCNIQNTIIIYYNPKNNLLLETITNQPFYITHNTSEIKDIISFFNQHKI